MKEYIFRTINELTLSWAGSMQCQSRYSYTYNLPEGMLLHYIISGKGTLRKGSRVYPVESGQAFVIQANEVCTYQADDKDPWSYMWFCCTGKAADQFLDTVGITRDSPVYTSSDHERVTESFNSFLDTVYKASNLFSLIGSFFGLLGVMTECSYKKTVTPRDPSAYVSICTGFIRKNYMQKLSVRDLCRIVNIDSSYLFRLFKQETGVSPQEYILNFKMEKACEFLGDRNRSVWEIANLVGYDDVPAFSKLFKKRFSLSPSEWRRKHI